MLLAVAAGVGAAAAVYFWFHGCEDKTKAAVKKEVEKAAEKVEKTVERVTNTSTLKLDKTASERSTRTASESVGTPKKEPPVVQVINLGLGNENEAPGQVQSTTVSPHPELQTPIQQSPSKDVETAHEPSVRACVTDSFQLNDQTSSKDVQTAREPSTREPAAVETSSSKDLNTARLHSDGVVAAPADLQPKQEPQKPEGPSTDVATARQSTTPIDQKPSEDVATAQVITDRSAAVVVNAAAAAKVEDTTQKPQEMPLPTDVTQKPEEPLQLDVTQKPQDAVGELKSDRPSEAKSDGGKKKKKHKKHKHKKNSKSNREPGEKKKSKKKKKNSKQSKNSKRSKKEAGASISTQPPPDA